jgi:hypothetical protein
MRSHGVFHTTIRFLSVLHSHIFVPVSHLRCCCRRCCYRLRMWADSAMILFVCKSSRRLGLGGSVVISRHRWLILRITVVSSRRSGRIGVCSPLIHGEFVGMEVSSQGRFRRSSQTNRAGCLLSQAIWGARKRRTDVGTGWPPVTRERVAKEEKTS